MKCTPLIACKLLGIRYTWVDASDVLVETWIRPHSDDIPEKHQDFFSKRVKTSQTHGAFMNLIDGIADIIVTHRAISPDEKEYAESVGVSLIETTIAIKNKTYPFISEVRVAIRSDLDHNSMAYKLYEWLQSEHAKYTISECGFF